MRLVISSLYVNKLLLTLYDCSAATIGNKLHVASKIVPDYKKSSLLKLLPSTFSSFGVGIIVCRVVLNVQVRINDLSYFHFHLGRRRRRRASRYGKSKLERSKCSGFG